MVLRPTPKQAQTIGPAEARPSALRPDSSIRRCSCDSAPPANAVFTASQSTMSSAPPTNTHNSMRSPANDTARYEPFAASS